MSCQGRRCGAGVPTLVRRVGVLLLLLLQRVFAGPSLRTVLWRSDRCRRRRGRGGVRAHQPAATEANVVEHGRGAHGNWLRVASPVVKDGRMVLHYGRAARCALVAGDVGNGRGGGRRRERPYIGVHCSQKRPRRVSGGCRELVALVRERERGQAERGRA